MRERTDWQVGDIVRLRKPHACGRADWQVLRMGMDVRLRCQTCGREVLLRRQEFEKRGPRRVEQAAAQKNHDCRKNPEIG